MVDKITDAAKAKEFCANNAAVLRDPQGAGYMIAYALLDLAQAQREHTDQMRRIANEFLAREKARRTAEIEGDFFEGDNP